MLTQSSKDYGRVRVDNHENVNSEFKDYGRVRADTSYENDPISADEIAALEEVQKLFGSDLVLAQNGRRFVKMGEMEKMSAKGPKKYYFHLFNDVLIYSRGSKSRLKVHGILTLKFTRISRATRMNVPFLPLFEQEWEDTSFLVESPDVSFVVKADSKEECMNWIEAIHMHQSDPEQYQLTVSSVQVPDKVIKNCPLCNVKFSLTVKKHHCQFCGTVVCSRCAPFKKSTNSRACDKCFDQGLTSSPRNSTTNTASRQTAENRTPGFGFIAANPSDSDEEEISDAGSEQIRQQNAAEYGHVTTLKYRPTRKRRGRPSQKVSARHRAMSADSVFIRVNRPPKISPGSVHGAKSDLIADHSAPPSPGPQDTDTLFKEALKNVSMLSRNMASGATRSPDSYDHQRPPPLSVASGVFVPEDEEEKQKPAPRNIKRFHQHVDAKTRDILSGEAKRGGLLAAAMINVNPSKNAVKVQLVNDRTGLDASGQMSPKAKQKHQEEQLDIYDALDDPLSMQPQPPQILRILSSPSAQPDGYWWKDTQEIFGVTLDHIMKLQKDLPDKVPRVMTYLIQLIKDMGGLETEGIFRVPGLSANMEFIKQQFREGIYDDIDRTDIENVHVPCSLLKAWLRELSDSLFPEACFADLLNISQTKDAERWNQLFHTLPRINKNIITYLVQFLREIAHHKSATKMSLSNIAIVFAPSLMRAPHDYEGDIFKMTTEMTKFLHFALETLDLGDSQNTELQNVAGGM